MSRHASRIRSSADRPLLRAAITGAIDAAAYGRYLAVEEDFVATATRVQGLCAWAAPTAAAAARHADAVAALAGGQRDHLAAQRRAHPVDPGAIPALLARAAVLRTHLLDVTRAHGYPAAVTSLLAAETLYLTWCRQAAAAPVVRPHAVQEWIDMHVADDFRAQVEALGTAVDALDPAAVPDALLDTWFLGMLDAEDRFHDAVLPDAQQDAPEDPPQGAHAGAGS